MKMAVTNCEDLIRSNELLIIQIKFLTLVGNDSEIQCHLKFEIQKFEIAVHCAKIIDKCPYVHSDLNAQ